MVYIVVCVVVVVVVLLKMGGWVIREVSVVLMDFSFVRLGCGCCNVLLFVNVVFSVLV